MLTPKFDKKFLLGSTVIAGFAALTAISGPAHAQSSDTTAAAAAIQQQSPEQGAPPEAAPDPAVVDTPDAANEARNNQGEPTSDDAAEVEAVVVTGSRIRRDPTNAPAPLIQVGRDEVLQSGEPNVVDFLADIPALQTSTVPEDTTGSNLNDGGLSLLDLRNLGSERTLVLVDGRRHVGAGQGTLEVDVDTIPSLLIESVEVVTGGQSALYGADAVSGVVNFILRRNFEGIELDASLAEINQDGQLNGRISGLVGANLLNDRLNVYAFGEYQKSDEVLDLDVDWRRNSVSTFTDDVDPSPGQPDTTVDIRAVSGVRTLGRPRGGILILANQPLPSPANDRDTPIQVCATAANTQATFVNPTNCLALRPDQPGTLFVFNADGTARLANFGTDAPGSGFSRGVNVGGDGLNLGTEQAQGSRLPEATNYRFQTGFNFEVNDGLELFGEAKYVKEEVFDSGQPTFFTAQVANIPAGQNGTLFNIQNFNIGLDNPFLPANARAAILANTRPTINTAGVVTGAVVDQRAGLQVFGPSRTQNREAEVQRYVLGIRGDRDQLGFISDFGYEVGYTYGKVESVNTEVGVDVERFALASDAVRNAAGQIVCRATDLVSRGITVVNQNTGANYAASDPTITNCRPVNLFGSDFRSDANEENITGGGGRPGLSAEQAAYLNAEINVEDVNEQHDFLAVVSGSLFENFLPAGPLGLALGYEYRKESTSSSGRDRDTAGRLLFLNTSPPFPETELDVNEVFGEFRLPLLRDLPLVDNLEISGAYRYSEYSTIDDGVETYSLQGQYRPVRDVLFRTTYGQATRIPTLSENFDPGGQTFGNGLSDPCDAVQLQSSAVPATIQANRRANCIALLGAGYDPNTTRIVYPAGVPGTSRGNLDLQPEDGRSYTFGAVITPRFIPRFSFVLDYYNIKISDVIFSVGAQDLLNNCVSGDALNPAACGLLFRNGSVPTPGGIPFGLLNQTGQIGFIATSLNYAALEAQGIDFQTRYAIDTADLLGGRDFGRLDYSLRGNYLIRQEDFINASDPGDARENDSLVGSPRVRFLSTLTYTPRENLSVTWDWDWQASQELRDSDLLLTDVDSRSADLLETESFSQHDFSVRYEVRDGITLRAGVVNAFDAEPPLEIQTGLLDSRGLAQTTLQLGDNFDFFGRRFFVGANLKLGAARD